MQTNQVLEILSRAGGPHNARIIVEKKPKISIFQARLIAHKLRHNVPVAKIIHSKWFYGIEFYTNKHTLDPRPDTETLIESVLHDAHKSPTILDLGTGTGCIICSLIKNIDDSSGLAVDISHSALRVARTNVSKLNLSHRIILKHANFTRHTSISQRFDIIVSNPPYIAKNDKRVDDGAKHDPAIALYAEQNGQGAYISIAQNAIHWIKPNGKIYLEIGLGMLNTVKKIFTNNGWNFIRADKDLSSHYRVVVFSPQQCKTI